jgi:hypothetical protein
MPNKYPLPKDDDMDFIAYMVVAACGVALAWFLLVWWFYV